MTPRPQGYREPTDEEMKCLPEGTLCWSETAEIWKPSTLIGGRMQEDAAYAVPSLTEKDKQLLRRYQIDTDFLTTDPLTQQIGGGHYKHLAIQPAEFIHRNKLGFLEGCIVKRVCRHRGKNKAEDLRKAIHELQLLLKLEYGEEP